MNRLAIRVHRAREGPCLFAAPGVVVLSEDLCDVGLDRLSDDVGDQRLFHSGQAHHPHQVRGIQGHEPAIELVEGDEVKPRGHAMAQLGALVVLLDRLLVMLPDRLGLLPHLVQRVDHSEAEANRAVNVLPQPRVGERRSLRELE